MKQFLLYLSVLFIAFTSIKGTNIDFEQSSWETILEQAQTQQLPIFVEMYADYCMPCKMMEKEVFSDHELAHFFNQNFINYKVNMQTEMGQKFSIIYDVQQLPTLLFLDYRGNKLEKLLGVKSKEELIALGKRISNQPNEHFATNSTKTIPSTKNVFEEPISNLDEKKAVSSVRETSPNPPVFFNNYLEEASIINQKLCKLRTVQKWHSEIYLAEVYDAAHNMQSKSVDWIAKKPMQFYQLFGREETQKKLYDSGKEAVQIAIQLQDKRLLKKACKIIKKVDYPNYKAIQVGWCGEYLAGVENWKAFAILFYGNQKELKPENILKAGWDLYNHSDDVKSWKIGQRFIKKQQKKKTLSPEMKTNFEVLSAHLYKKMGKHRKAKKVAHKTLKDSTIGLRNQSQLNQLLQTLETD